MGLVNERELQKVVSDFHNQTLSYRYDEEDYLTKLEIKKLNDELLAVEASYLVNGFRNTCRLSIDDVNQTVESYTCNCKWCNEETGCAHVGATILRLMNLEVNSYPYVYEVDYKKLMEEKNRRYEQERLEYLKQNSYKKTKALIESMKSNLFEDSFKIVAGIKVNFEPLIEYDVYTRKTQLNFRFGEDKTYILKDIEKFVDDIENKRFVKYGKQLEFLHDETVFDEEGLKILKFLRKSIYQNKQNNRLFYQNTHLNRYILIDDKNIDDFYNTFADLNIEYTNMKFDESLELVKVNVKDEQEHYEISINNEYLFKGKNSAYRIIKNEINEIIKIPFDNQGKTIKFINYVISEGKILVNKKDFNDFYKYILADISNYLDIEGIEIKDYVEHENRIVLYADVDRYERIKIKLECIYDNEIRYGFDNDYINKSLNLEKIEKFIIEYATEINYEKHIAYFDDHLDKTYVFMKEGLPLLSDYCDILVSEALRNIGTAKKYNVKVGVTVNNNLLEVNLSSTDIPKEDLAEVLKSYRRKKKFYKLKNGEIIHLESNELRELDKLLKEYNVNPNQIQNGKLTMNLYRAFALDDEANHNEFIEFDRSEKFTKLVNNFKNVNHNEAPILDNYENILKDYQKFGYKWIKMLQHYGFGGILADDMGLGKTLQVIAVIEGDKTNLGPKTSIVICPSSLILNWQDEVYKFASNLRCKCIYGTQNERKELLSEYKDYDLLVTSYDYIRRDYELYKEMDFRYVVLDEAQYIKNQNTKNASSVKQIRGDYKLALTGTPIENSLAELWSIFDFLMPDYLYNYHYFKVNFESPIVREKDEEAQKELKKLIEPFILRRNKKEVLKDLPDKVENTIKFDFSDEEKNLYFANLAQVNDSLKEQLKLNKIDKMQVLAMLTRLRQICCEPRLIYEDINHVSSKLQGCIDLVENLKNQNKKILLFSSFTSALDLISRELEQRNISYFMLTGSTNKEERRKLVQQFQKDNTTIFLISLKAGGTGLNLTAASAVIHFDPWWNVSAQNQATDRSYRIGQTDNVEVYKLIMRNSIEEKIVDLQETKKNLADTFVENNVGSLTQMDTNKILELFKF